MERHERQAPRIEARKERGDHQQGEGETGYRAVRGKGRLDDRVLREEASRTEERTGNTDTGQRDRTDEHHPVGDRDVLPEATHVAHVLLAIDGVNDRTGTQEQESLEEGVCEQVEDRCAIGADAERHEHVAELRAGRIGDDPLDVVLNETDGRGKEGRDRTDQRDDGECIRRQLEQR
ncbi:hypothetical protein D9M72_512260 [compost metagenome]